MGELSEKRNITDKNAKIKISFREFIKILVKMADGAFPKFDPANRVTKLLSVMDK
jgi:hypothetical protein